MTAAAAAAASAAAKAAGSSPRGRRTGVGRILPPLLSLHFDFFHKGSQAICPADLPPSIALVAASSLLLPGPRVASTKPFRTPKHMAAFCSFMPHGLCPAICASRRAPSPTFSRSAVSDHPLKVAIPPPHAALPVAACLPAGCLPACLATGCLRLRALLGARCSKTEAVCPFPHTQACGNKTVRVQAYKEEPTHGEQRQQLSPSSPPTPPSPLLETILNPSAMWRILTVSLGCHKRREACREPGLPQAEGSSQVNSLTCRLAGLSMHPSTPAAAPLPPSPLAAARAQPCAGTLDPFFLPLGSCAFVFRTCSWWL